MLPVGIHIVNVFPTLQTITWNSPCCDVWFEHGPMLFRLQAACGSSFWQYHSELLQLQRIFSVRISKKVTMRGAKCGFWATSAFSQRVLGMWTGALASPAAKSRYVNLWITRWAPWCSAERMGHRFLENVQSSMGFQPNIPKAIPFVYREHYMTNFILTFKQFDSLAFTQSTIYIILYIYPKPKIRAIAQKTEAPEPIYKFHHRCLRKCQNPGELDVEVFWYPTALIKT